MADLELKSNSLRIRFPRGCQEPSDARIFEHMKNKLALKHDDLLAMYKDRAELSVIIKFKAEFNVVEFLRSHNRKMDFFFDENQKCEVELSLANAVVRYVRLFNLPPEVEDREVVATMTKFGKVQRTVREKYGVDTGFPIWTSVRGVYMEIADGVEIPATVHVRNIRARVFYDGLVNKCFQCGSTEHLKAECTVKRSVNGRLGSGGAEAGNVIDGNAGAQLSYSKVARGWTKLRAGVSPRVITENVVPQSELTNLNELFSKAIPKASVIPVVPSIHKPLEKALDGLPASTDGSEEGVEASSSRGAQPMLDNKQKEASDSSLKRDRNGERRGTTNERASSSDDASESGSETENQITISGAQSVLTRTQKKKLLKMRTSGAVGNNNVNVPGK